MDDLSIRLDNCRTLWLTEISRKTFEDQDLDQLESDGGLFVVLEDHSEGRFEVLAKAASIWAGQPTTRPLGLNVQQQATSRFKLEPYPTSRAPDRKSSRRSTNRDILHRPKPSFDPRRHCWGHPQRLVNPNEIVPERIERDHVRVVFELLPEGVRQPVNRAHRHPHCQVRPLHIGRADVLRIGIAGDLSRVASRRTLTGCSVERLPARMAARRRA